MMFKGSTHYSKDVFAHLLPSKGAEFNAFTTPDYTGYHITLPGENLKLAISLEADRMRNLLLDPNDVKSEREVVKEERRMRYDNQPEGVIHETMDSMLYKNLPYRWPTIGSMEDLNQASMADLRAFYKRYYSPNNAVVVVAGDFNPSDVKRWIEESYGKINAEDIKRKTFPPEWEQKKPQEKTIQRNVQSPIYAIGFLTPAANHPDTYALDLLATALAQGVSSRLYKKMVYEQQIATNVYAGCQESMLAGRCSIFAYLKPGANTKVVGPTIAAEIRELAKEKVSTRELEKVKNNYLMEYVNALGTLNGRAQALALNEIVFGDYQKLFTDMAKIQAVTAADIQRVAQKYFKPERKNTIIVVPNGKTVSMNDSGATK
jgi:zinc protease